jgi:hypothetical protein
MSYVFTEDDYDKLVGVKQQLALMASLLATAKRVACDSDCLESAFWALQEPIATVLKTLDERSEIALHSQGMTAFDWVHIITLVSGRDSMSVADIVKMDQKLMKAVAIDPDMRHVYNAWEKVMTDDGKNPMMQDRNDMGGFHVKFERPVQADIPPATEESILAVYGAKDAKDLVKRLVATCNGADPNNYGNKAENSKKRRKRAPVAA